MPIVPILCAVLLLAGIALLAMSGKTWRWYHITVSAFILLLSLVWFYMAARVLKIEDAWRNEIRAYEKAFAQEKETEKKILEGGEDAEGKAHIPLVQLKNDVAKSLQGRGRVWDHVVRAGVIGRDGTINATTEHPEGLEKNLVVWVYDEGPSDGKNALLGQFEVDQVNGNNVKLIPALKLRAAELARIAKPNNAPLVLYEIMPTDSPELSLEVAKAFPSGVPASVKSEYEKEGKAPQANDPPDRVWLRVKAVKEFAVPLSSAEAKELQARKTTPPSETDVVTNELKIAEGTLLLLDPKSAAERIAAGDVALASAADPAAADSGAEPAATEEHAPSQKVYVRQFRDYAQLYRDLNLQIEDLLRSFTEVDNQNKAVVDATAKVAKDTEFRGKEKVALTADLGHFVSDLNVIRKHVTALSEMLTKAKAEIKSLIAANRELSNEIAKITRDAADRINRQSATAAAANQ
jgi:hypothetical protein